MHLFDTNCTNCSDPLVVDNTKAVDFVIRDGKLEKYNGSSTDIVIPEMVK